jgi:ABC-type phosphate/phosphonate transport system permease subunit
VREVGAGGLGQMLAFHMGLFQMGETSSVLLAMMLLVALVDALSYLIRSALSRRKSALSAPLHRRHYQHTPP